MLALRLWLRLSVPVSIREMPTFKLALMDWIFTRAAVTQGVIAMLTAAWARRSGILLALFAAFIAGCVITIGTLSINLLLGGSIDLDFTWIVFSGIVIPGGLLAVLLAPLTELLTKRLGPTLRAALIAALLYCGLVLCITFIWRFMTLESVPDNLFSFGGIALLVVFQILVGTIVAVRSRKLGWLFGLITAYITGLVGWSITVPLATTISLTSFTQIGFIILTSAYTAALGTLMALPVVLVAYFIARWIWSSRMRKIDEIPAPSTASTSSKL